MNKYSMIALAVLASAAFSQSALALQMVKSQEVHNDVIVSPSTYLEGEVISHQNELVGGVANDGKTFFDLKIKYPTTGITKLGFCGDSECSTGITTAGNWPVKTPNEDSTWNMQLLNQQATIDPSGKWNLVDGNELGETLLPFTIVSAEPLPTGTWRVTGHIATFMN